MMSLPWLFSFALLMCAQVCFGAGAVRTLAVKMTLVPKAAATGALCLDGSPPGYHLHRGSGAGVHNWLLQFEGGGWCNDLKSCAERANSRRGSTRLMNKMAIFSGILTDHAALNPDFHNWNRVKIRYCDGASFTGDAVYKNGSKTLYFRGARIWEALIRDLLPKGLGRAKNALLSGCSAGGLSAFLHCDNLTRQLPATTHVKCLSDAGFFLDGKDVSGKFTFRSIYNSLIKLQGAGPNLNKNCNPSPANPSQCFFPQYLLKDMKTPFFVLNTAYDVFQFKHILVPPSADTTRVWGECTLDPGACNAEQIETLQGFRQEMLAALKILEDSDAGGMFINSCFAHCQSESQDTWLANDSPRINNKTISEVVGNWYFNRKPAKEIDCPYPCSKTCHNLIPTLSTTKPATN